jgi:DNA-binding response OmpR family regulator
MGLTALVVEDDAGVVDIIRDALAAEGIACVRAVDGMAALVAIAASRPDLVVLDVNLPGMSGLEVCRRIRESPTTARLPIIIVSGLDTEVDHVRGLDTGADDYISKPFGIPELLARVRAVLRRSIPPRGAPPRRIGDLAVDVTRRQALLGGTVLPLTPTEFGLLEALAGAGGRALSRSDLLAAVRGYAKPEEIESRTIDVHMGRLRMKLGPEARRILTVRGFGYRLDTDD